MSKNDQIRARVPALTSRTASEWTRFDKSEEGRKYKVQREAFGVLHSATPGNDYCNGKIAPIISTNSQCMCDCLHIDDVAVVLKEKGLDKRPPGK